MAQKGYLLDTNIFNDLVKKQLHFDQLPSDGQFWATHVQWRELRATPDDDTRMELESKFHELVSPERQVPAGFALGVKGAGWGEGEFGHNASLWLALKEGLDQKKEKENNREDASIAEAAKFFGLTLMTGDGILAEVATKHGIDVCLFKWSRQHGHKIEA